MILNNSKFHPPGYIPTEQEHRIAYLTYQLQYIYYEYLLGINMVRTGKMKDDCRKDIDGTQSLVERELSYIDKMFAGWRDDGSNEVWEIRYPYEEFKKNHIEHLSEAHCGDCTCAPAPCLRCHAEELYKIPYTATWCKSCEFYLYKDCEHHKKEVK